MPDKELKLTINEFRILGVILSELSFTWNGDDKRYTTEGQEPIIQIYREDMKSFKNLLEKFNVIK